MEKDNTKKNTNKDLSRSNKKINFKTLFIMFKWKFLRHLTFTIIATFLGIFLSTTVENLMLENFNGKKSSHSVQSNCNSVGHDHKFHPISKEEINENINEEEKFNDDYSLFFPRREFLKEFFNQRSLEKNEFCLIISFLFIIYSIIKYYDSKWENDISTSSSSYIKNELLKKFRSLKFESKIEKKDEIKFLAESESNLVGSSWEHLFNHTFHNFLEIIVTIFLRFYDLRKMNNYSKLFSFFWIIVINVLNIFILNILSEKELKHKDHLTKEIAFIDKETSKSLLIESMGISSEYEKEQVGITKENVYFKKLINKYGSINSSLLYLLLELYIPILFFFNDKPFSSLPGFLVFWNIYHGIGGILECFREYPSYSSACSKINNFLSLSSNDENLDKEKVNPKDIKEIIFSNVDFKYSSGEELLFKNYNKVFLSEEINNLSGKNGTGKSTIIYLLLGMVKPLSGNIFVNLLNGKKLDLNRDINLRHWKEKIVAFCSHDNLIEEGSTGQRQIENIKEVISKKSDAKIFVFDEASNALDADKQKFLLKKIEKMIKNKKIVIYVKH